MHTKNRKLTVASLTLAGCLAVLTGCAKQKTYGAVKFSTEPPGAEVVNLKDDASLCTTPCVGFWEAEEGKPEYVTVEMRKTGYKEEITSFWVNTRHNTREEAEKDALPINADLIKRGN